MAYKETFWMASDSTEGSRAEYGPFSSREEAEMEARTLGFGYLLRYEHIIAESGEIEEVRSIFIELPGARIQRMSPQPPKFHTRCATCGVAAVHDEPYLAEVWADIHEFEHARHFVRLFEQSRGDGMREIGNWREL